MNIMRNYIARKQILQTLDCSRRPGIDFRNDMHQFKNDIYFDIQNAKSECFIDKL